MPDARGRRSTNVGEVAKNLKSQMSKLSKRGPHRPLVGALDHAGLRGTVYTPATGRDLPAIAFGHQWMRGSRHYAETFSHLASWGIVVACPDTERGPVPSHLRHAEDMVTALEIAREVRLGAGDITVDPQRLAMAGHGTGAGVAVLAAARDVTVRAVAALYPEEVSPRATDAAEELEIPGLVVGDGVDTRFVVANTPAERLAAAWAGEVAHRELASGSGEAFAEHGAAMRVLGFVPGGAGKVRRSTRALLTGFLLSALTGDRTYAAFTDITAEIPGFPRAEIADHTPAPGDILSAFRGS